MLNTIMALWNHDPGENKQRIVKVLFTFLFIGSSIFLLLLTLNSSAWFPLARTQYLQTKKEEPVHMSNHRAIATVGNTPTSNPGITPTATLSTTQATATLSTTQAVVQPYVPTPPIVVRQQATATPQKAVIYYGNSGLGNKRSTQRHVASKALHARKDKLRSRKRPKVKVIATPTPQARETVNTILPSSPIPAPATLQPTVTPVVMASATVPTVPEEGTGVSNVPQF